MGKTVTCTECGRLYQDLESLEELRDNDGICLTCNAPIAVADWDRVLDSYDEDEDLDDLDAEVDEDGLDEFEDWSGDLVDEEGPEVLADGDPDPDDDLDNFYDDR